MRKIITIVIAISVVLALLPVSSALASTGCSVLNGASGTANPTFAVAGGAFEEGDTVGLTIAGTGTTFSLLEGGSVVVGPVPVGSSLTYIIPADGTYSFSASVTGSDATTTATFSCAGDEPDPGVICHRPPGNPAAAHTIVVGVPAVDAHLAHGDTLGPCPEGVQTKFDDFGDGISIFVIASTGEISIWGNCVEDDCAPVLVTTVTQIINISAVIVTGDSPHFIIVDDPEDVQFTVDDEVDDGMFVVIYYLHPDPSDDTVGVFQINIYHDGELINDDILVFVDLDGDIVRWTTHAYWIRLLQG